MIGKLLDKLTYANVVATIALIAGLSGGTLGAYAAFRVPPNSVGSRQLKAKAVTGGKIANATISGGKLEPESITGSDLKLSALGTVPMAANAANAAEAARVGGHAASCPEHTLLIRGLCFDSSSNPAAPTLNAAAEACASKGGWLPTPMELYSVHSVLNLGSGSGSEVQFTDSLYGEVSVGNLPATVVIFGTGQFKEQPVDESAQYYCVYPLVR